MAQVKVVATRTGYYEHKRHREGSVFFMDDSLFKKDPKDGSLLLPSWVEYVDKSEKNDKKPKGKNDSKFNEDVI